MPSVSTQTMSKARSHLPGKQLALQRMDVTWTACEENEAENSEKEFIL